MVKKKRFRRYIPWFSATPDLEVEDQKEDDFVSYIHRNMHPYFGEESPFPGSEWSYTKRESVFDREETSDFELHQDAVNALYGCEDIDASQVNVNVINGVIILSGYVKTEYEKQTAQKVLEELAGVWNIRNEIQLDTSDAAGSHYMQL